MDKTTDVAKAPPAIQIAMGAAAMLTPSIVTPATENKIKPATKTVTNSAVAARPAVT